MKTSSLFLSFLFLSQPLWADTAVHSQPAAAHANAAAESPAAMVSTILNKQAATLQSIAATMEGIRDAGSAEAAEQTLIRLFSQVKEGSSALQSAAETHRIPEEELRVLVEQYLSDHGSALHALEVRVYAAAKRLADAGCYGSDVLAKALAEERLGKYNVISEQEMRDFVREHTRVAKEITHLLLSIQDESSAGEAAPQIQALCEQQYALWSRFAREYRDPTKSPLLLQIWVSAEKTLEEETEIWQQQLQRLSEAKFYNSEALAEVLSKYLL